jgi:sialate O-acetylesterase
MLPPSALLFLTLLAPACGGEVRFANVFADHMVLQRETQAAIWGTADPGDQVTVEASWGGDPVRATADADGRWQVELATPAAGGPFTVTASSGGATAVLEDVLSGEVWVCSGQSNMEWNMAWIEPGIDAARTADHPLLRLCFVEKTTAAAPQPEVDARWEVCTPNSVLPFSATAYFFGRELMRAMPEVPIGLVRSAWGGTVAEAWTSEETLRRLGGFEEVLDRVVALRSGGGADTVEQLQAKWWARVAATDPGMKERWQLPQTDLADWDSGQVPTMFAQLGWADFDGLGWFRRSFEVPRHWQGKDLVLHLGAVDDMDVTWINGQEIGSVRVPGRYQAARDYAIPAALVSEGVNTLAVCAIDTGGAGTIGWSSSGPSSVRLALADGSEELVLDGEWRVKRGCTMGDLGGPMPTSGWFDQNGPTALSNGMIEPLVPMAMRGVIWYQGESNRERALQYRELFPAMIRDWRTRWGRGDFPFYWVQIAPFGYGGDRGEAAELREAQTMTLSLPNTGQAVTMDIGDPGDIHPQEKVEVGRRLALIALARDYGQQVAYQGPSYRSVDFDGRRALLQFDHAEGLELRGDTPGQWFQIAGKDQRFVRAKAEVAADGSVVVWSDEVSEPRAVRFAWGAADASNLFNAAGLPAPSFRTDPWPAVSWGR